MFPQQSSKVLPTVVTIVVLILVIKNPVGAAHFVRSLVDAINKFTGAL
jgi:hypothetical protein